MTRIPVSTGSFLLVLFFVRVWPDTGPSTWPEKFPLAAGSRQSPVDILTDQVESDSSLDSRPLTWNYMPENCLGIVNPGYSWRVDVDGENSELTGGPLHGKYKLEQFHCHWGRANNEGSEHTVDGKSYAGELHLVHWNCEKYPSFSEAVQHPDGLAVLGILLQIGDETHEEIEKIVQLIPDITFKGQKVPIPGTLDPAKFLPTDVSYWTYPGSLTTPPCTESVTWIIFKQPVIVSDRQVEAFRTLRTYSEEDGCPCGEGQVLYNYRPPLPLGNRVLRECGAM